MQSKIVKVVVADNRCSSSWIPQGSTCGWTTEEKKWERETEEICMDFGEHGEIGVSEWMARE